MKESGDVVWVDYVVSLVVDYCQVSLVVDYCQDLF